ncbi:MAG: HTTM domain-containing protein [Methylococcaceae bacterium]|nr:HTTM domain-containing protein [Methylococcaceae bacterium]
MDRPLMQDVWNNFWFRSIDARQYAVLRIGFGCLSTVYLSQLLPYVETQFSGLGWLGSIQQIAIQNGGSWSLFFLSVTSHSLPFAYAIVILGILAAFLLMIGWQSRLAAFITWLIWVSLWNRNPLLLDGDDAVLKMMSFYLMLAPCGNCWSIDACFQKKPEYVAVWPLRLIQFQIALIYFVSGWVKFHSPEWLDGTIMQYVLVHPQYSRWDGWLIIDSTLSTSLLTNLAGVIRWWELLFPFLLLNPYIRKPSLLFGLLFHLGLLLTMNLRWFPIIMLSLYPALISNSYFLRLEERFFNPRHKDV